MPTMAMSLDSAEDDVTQFSHRGLTDQVLIGKTIMSRQIVTWREYSHTFDGSYDVDGVLFPHWLSPDSLFLKFVSPSTPYSLLSRSTSSTT